MKSRPQLMPLFEEQLSPSNRTIGPRHLILRCHKTSENCFVTDSFHSSQLLIRNRKRHKRRYPELKRSLSELRDGSLYCFAFCRMKSFLENNKLRVVLICRGFGLVVPFLGRQVPQMPVLVEDDLEEVDRERSKRKVT